MQGTAAHRRKGGGASSKSDGGTPSPSAASSPTPSASPPVATVKRRKWGTSPFDEHWLNLDCCGLFCALFTYFLHGYGCWTVCLILLPPWMSLVGEDSIRRMTFWGRFHCVAFCAVAIMACLSHFKAMTTDPGAVPPDAKPLTEPQQEEEKADEDPKEEKAKPRKHVRLCRRCNAFKPQRAHHCSVCKRCIIKMDHHCPWVNNCVGIGNHKYFLLFIFYTALSCGYSLTLMVLRGWACTSRHSRRSRNMHCLDEPSHLINLLFLVVESLLFGLFTCCMKVDQWDVVMSNMTHIDRLKGSQDPSRRRVPGTTEVFGVGKRGRGKFRPDWLSPFASVCFPTSVRDDIFGYCRPGASVSNASDLDVEMAPLMATGGSGRVVRSVTEIV